MSLFIASEAYPNPQDFAASKIAIFVASLIAGVAGTAMLWRKPSAQESAAVSPDGERLAAVAETQQ